MNKKFLLKSTVFVGLLFAALVISPAAHAIPTPTLVQFDPTATSTYTIKGIQEFDWQSSGNVVIEDALVTSSTGATTLAGFFTGAPVSGVDTITMNIHGHARLNDFLNTGGTSIIAAGLSRDGGATGSWEVTASFDGIETATYYNIGGDHTLDFTTITGTFQYYLDGTPDSIVGTAGGGVPGEGTGFNDGDIGAVPFLNGTLTLIDGTFNGTTGNGATYLTNTITGYDPTVIETDPTSPFAFLIGTTFDTTVTFVSLLQASVGVGDFIGGDIPANAYTVLANDLILNADASSEFKAEVIPEPATMLLLGSGLLSLVGFSRRKFKK